MQANVQVQSLEEQIRALKAENDRLKASKVRAISMKVGEKGGLCVYGLGRFPVTLYRSQWERLLGAKDDILAYIEAHADSLQTKD